MRRLNEQLALCTSVKFKAFRPTANSRLGEETNSDLGGMGPGGRQGDSSSALSSPTCISLAFFSLPGDLSIAPSRVQKRKGLISIWPGVPDWPQQRGVFSTPGKGLENENFLAQALIILITWGTREEAPPAQPQNSTIFRCKWAHARQLSVSLDLL